MKNILFTIVIAVLVQTGCAQTDSIDYFGQTPPGDSAVVFAPGIISLANRLESKIAFSHDGNEVYFQAYTPDYISKIYYTKRINDKWTEQVEASFSVNNNIGNPFLSADGNRLYFNSNDRTNSDIYMVERISDGWGESQLLPEPINSNLNESSYTETANGDIYFESKRSGGLGGYDIWYKHHSSDQAKNLGSPVNTTDFDSNPFIAKDGSYIIFGSERNGRQGLAHLYISFKTGNGGWSTPVDMNTSGAQINRNDAHHSGPSISPDGKFLFFFRHYDMTTMDIYWVSTTAIDDIKKKVFDEGDYLGQTPPGDSAVVFAPEIISTPGNNEHTICFSPDGKELFFTRDPERTTYTIKFENGSWSKPARAHFEGREAIFTPDGTKLYYNDGDIRRTEKINGEWKHPVRIPAPVSSDGHDYFASFTNDGVMYFSRFIAGGQARIYRSKLTYGKYGVVEDIGEPINHQAFNSYHPFIAPNESYIIFNSADRPDGFGGADLYICFRKDDNSWSSPINMGSTINSSDSDLCPIVTFDNNYFFFTRYKNGEGNIYWISSAIIERLKSLSTDIKLNNNDSPKSIKLNQN